MSRFSACALLVMSFVCSAFAQMPEAQVLEPEPQVTLPQPAPRPELVPVERGLPVIRTDASRLPSGVTTQNDLGSNGEVYTSTPPSPYASGILLLAKSGTPDVHVKLGTSTSAADFTVFNSGDLGVFTITGDRKLGLGTSSPVEAFHIVKDGNVLTRLRVDNASTNGGTSLSMTDGTATRAEWTSYGSTVPGKVNTLQLWNYAGGPLMIGLFDPVAGQSYERMRIKEDGTVGFGITAPVHRVHAVSAVDGVQSVYGHTTTTVEANVTQNDYGVSAFGYQNVATGVTNSGLIGGLRVRGYLTGPGRVENTYGAFIETGVLSPITGTIGRARGVFISVAGSGVVEEGHGVYVSNVAATTAHGVYLADLNGTGTAFGIYQNGSNDNNYFAGKVGIGKNNPTKALDVVGDAHFTGTVTGGNIKAHYQDVAEWVPATTDLSPGTVVVLNPNRDNEVMMSHAPYDTTVAGVVSAQPGLSLGVEGEGKEQIATTGRVLVRVDARNAPIRVGDLLVTSDVPGTAMRSEPMAINGRKFHQPGTIIGKALQPLANGVGEILVLLSMQ